jgi:hypothetical protein
MADSSDQIRTKHEFPAHAPYELEKGDSDSHAKTGVDATAMAAAFSVLAIIAMEALLYAGPEPKFWQGLIVSW